MFKQPFAAHPHPGKQIWPDWTHLQDIVWYWLLSHSQVTSSRQQSGTNGFLVHTVFRTPFVSSHPPESDGLTIDMWHLSAWHLVPHTNGTQTAPLQELHHLVLHLWVALGAEGRLPNAISYRAQQIMKQCHTLLRHENPEDSPQLLVQSSDKWCEQDNIWYPTMFHWASILLPLHQGSVPASEGHPCPCILQLSSYTQTWLLLGHEEWGEYRLPHYSQRAPVLVLELLRRHLVNCILWQVLSSTLSAIAEVEQFVCYFYGAPHVTGECDEARRVEGTVRG